MVWVGLSGWRYHLHSPFRNPLKDPGSPWRQEVSVSSAFHESFGSFPSWWCNSYNTSKLYTGFSLTSLLASAFIYLWNPTSPYLPTYLPTYGSTYLPIKQNNKLAPLAWLENSISKLLLAITIVINIPMSAKQTTEDRWCYTTIRRYVILTCHPQLNCRKFHVSFTGPEVSSKLSYQNVCNSILNASLGNYKHAVLYLLKIFNGIYYAVPVKLKERRALTKNH